MNVQEVKTVVTKWIDNKDLPPLILTGAAGIGKTQTLIDVCREKKRHLEIIRVGSLDSPGDLLGLPEVVQEVDKDGNTYGVTKFSRVEMFERLKDGGVLFLDEMNRCKPVLMDSIMQILDQKKLANYDLSHVSIMGAMNPDTDDYSVTEMDKAVIDRCLFIKCSNSVDTVVQYQTDTGFDVRITEFTLLGESHVKCNGDYSLPQKEMTPRGLRQFNQIMPIIDSVNDEIATELILACVGPNGVSTWKNRSILRDLPSAAEFLASPEKHKVAEMEPLKKRILMLRVNAWAGDNKPKDSNKFTETMLDFGQAQLGYIMRHLSNINKKMNKQNTKFAEMAKEIIEILK